MSEIRNFHVVRGNTRRHPRQGKPTLVLNGKIGDSYYEQVEILSIEFGIVSLRVVNFHNDKVISGEPIELSLYCNNRMQISGIWVVSKFRKEGKNAVIKCERREIARARELEGRFDPGFLLKSSGYKFFFLDDLNDLVEIRRHITDLKDFGTPISCRFSSDTGRVFFGNFNFDSNIKALSSLEFSNNEKGLELSTNSVLTVEYVFLSVRYIFRTAVDGLDADFNIISTKIPSCIVALTARNLERWKSSIPIKAKLGSNSKEIDCLVSRISPLGCEIEISNKELQAGDYLTFSVEGINSEISGQVTTVRKGAIGLAFSSNGNCLPGIRALFLQTINPPFILRDVKNYELFYQLYKQVGYAPKEESSYNKWKQETEYAWRIQDEILPGNTIGSLENSSLAASFGVIPLSKKVLYGHSIAMLKTVGSIGPFFDICAHNLSWAELIEGVEFYCGSTRRKSNFSTRLHNIFEFHSFPSSHCVYSAVAILPEKQEYIPNSNNNFHEMKPIKLDEKTNIPDPIRNLINLISEQELLFEKYHKTSIFGLWNKSSSELEAITVCHKSEPFFTAANILRCVWLFTLKDGVSISSIYQSLQANPSTRELEIDVFNPDLKTFTPPDLQNKYEEVFWYFFSKDEFGPILASIARACWSVLKKYGQDADVYLKKFVE